MCAVLRTPPVKGPGCRDWTHDFIAKRNAKKDLRERLFVVLVKRMAQVGKAASCSGQIASVADTSGVDGLKLSMARLVKEEVTMLSVLLGRRPGAIEVKGVGPTVKPLQENTDNKCYCGYSSTNLALAIYGLITFSCYQTRLWFLQSTQETLRIVFGFPLRCLRNAASATPSCK